MQNPAMNRTVRPVCGGRLKYPTAYSACKAILRLYKKDLKNGREPHRLIAYACPECKGVHQGNPKSILNNRRVRKWWDPWEFFDKAFIAAIFFER